MVNLPVEQRGSHAKKKQAVYLSVRACVFVLCRFVHFVPYFHYNTLLAVFGLLADHFGNPEKRKL